APRNRSRASSSRCARPSRSVSSHRCAAPSRSRSCGPRRSRPLPQAARRRCPPGSSRPNRLPVPRGPTRPWDATTVPERSAEPDGIPCTQGRRRARRAGGARPRPLHRRVRARAREPGGVALERAAALQPRRADGEGGTDDDEDRADGPERLRHRLVRARERLEAAGAVDRFRRGRCRPAGDVDRREHADRRGLALPVPRPAGEVRDVLGRLDRQLERPGVVRVAGADDRGALVDRRGNLDAHDRRARPRRGRHPPRRLRAPRPRRRGREADRLTVRRSTGIAVAAVVAALVLPAAASAHAYLTHTVPQASVTLNSPPPDVELTFDEAVEPRFAIISVTDAEGRSVTSGPLFRSPSNPDTLIVPLKRVPEGWYLVYWRAISVDGHPVQSAFQFAVGPNAGPVPQFNVPHINGTATTTPLLIARWLMFLTVMSAIGLFVLRMLIARPMVRLVEGTTLRALSIGCVVAAVLGLVATPIY